ncbi:MAG TPA: hypothetical protein VK760_06760 [Candidatus Acidoferrales bacterium]|nr:hypothetical protein [Candidatus Acidoferrales bacterium]
MQLSVGTANFSGAAVGLNVLETFRDSNGFTAVPISSATLLTPASLHGVASSKDPGAHASGRFPLGSVGNTFLIGGAGTQSEIAGVDGFGIGPPSCSCPGANLYPMQPQFADNPDLAIAFPGHSGEPFYGGPPAYPPTVLAPNSQSSLVSIPTSSPEGFYLMGFSKVPSGKYTLQASYSRNGAATTVSASAQLNAARVLPSLSFPLLIPHKNGSIDVEVRLPRGVKQVFVYVIDAEVPPAGNACSTGLGFSTLVFNHSGTQTIPANLGNYGQGGAQTFCNGDLIEAQSFGFDYDDFDLGPPGNVEQRPALPAQADMTISNPSITAIPAK